MDIAMDFNKRTDKNNCLFGKKYHFVMRTYR